jgi:predicted transcriptional regulator
MKPRHEMRLGIASPKEMKERLLAAARGEAPPVTEEAKIWMEPEALLRLLTTDNRKLLTVMAQEHPRSVSVLAERVGRDQGNVSRAIGALVNAGFVRLVNEGREKRPEVAVEQLHIDIDLVRDRFVAHADALETPTEAEITRASPPTTFAGSGAFNEKRRIGIATLRKEPDDPATTGQGSGRRETDRPKHRV